MATNQIPPTGLTRPYDYILIQYQVAQSSGQYAGAALTGSSWNTRTLNTLVTDTSGLVSLASQQVLLPTGTYEIRAWANASSCDYSQLRWQNMTDATTTLLGGASYAPASSGAAIIHLSGRFTIAASKNFQLQHYAQTSAGQGQGFINIAPGSYGVLAQVELLRIGA